MLNFEAGIAVVEMPQTQLRNLEAKVYREYDTRISMSDPCSENTLVPFSGKSYALSVCNVHVKEFKNPIYEDKLIGKRYGQRIITPSPRW